MNDRSALTLSGVTLLVALLGSAYTAGYEAGTPVFDVVEIVWLAPRAEEAEADHDRALRFDVPFKLAVDIRVAAARYGVPVDLAFALVDAESDFTRTAQSVMGALGYTQVMPATGLTHCDLTPVDLFVPRLNLDCGFSYLRTMHDRFGSWRLALVAYHRGPTRTDKEIFLGFPHGLSEAYATGILTDADTGGTS